MNECCTYPENRDSGPGPRGADDAPDGVTITHCRVCECRHFEVTVDPGKFGIQGAAL